MTVALQISGALGAGTRIVMVVNEPVVDDIEDATQRKKFSGDMVLNDILVEMSGKGCTSIL